MPTIASILHKAYALVDIGHTGIDDKFNADSRELPSDWKDLLLPERVTDLNKHIGTSSNYSEKSSLEAALKKIFLHYPHFTESEKAAIRIKLCEEITMCTPGFHNRVNEILLSLNRPTTFEAVLQCIREELVVEVARKNYFDDVHELNYFNTRAFLMGYGVRRINTNDPYLPLKLTQSLTDRKIKSYFKNNFTPYHLSHLILSYLKSFIAGDYSGKKDNGYLWGDARRIANIFHQYLNLDPIELNQPYSLFLEESRDDKDGIPISIFYDLNWKKIQAKALNKLENDGYISANAKPCTVLDFITFYFLHPEEAISNYVTLGPYDDALTQVPLLCEFYNQAPDVLRNQLINHESFLTLVNRPPFNEYLFLSQNNMQIYLRIIAFIFVKHITNVKRIYLHLLENDSALFNTLLTLAQSNDTLLTKIINALDEKNDNGFTVLHLMALNTPQTLCQLVEFARSNTHVLSKILLNKIINTLDKQTDNQWTVLHMIARYSPQALCQLIQLAQSNPNLLIKIIGMLDKQTDKQSTVLYMIAQYSPQALCQLIQLAQSNPNLLAKIIDTLDKQTDKQWTVLHMMARCSPQALCQLIQLAQSNPNLLIKIIDILDKQNHDQWTVLHMIARCSPQALCQLIQLAQSNPNLLIKIIDILDKQNHDQWTVLHMIAQYSPQALCQLIQLAQSNPNLLAKIIDTLDKQTDNQWTVLHVIARYSPQVLCQLLALAKLNTRYQKKIIAATNPTFNLENWTSTHYIFYYGKKIDVDIYINFMMSHQDGAKVLLDHLGKEATSKKPHVSKSIKTGKDFLKLRGVIFPKNQDRETLFEFMKNYSHRSPAHKPPLTKRKEQENKMRLFKLKTKKETEKLAHRMGVNP